MSTMPSPHGRRIIHALNGAITEGIFVEGVLKYLPRAFCRDWSVLDRTLPIQALSHKAIFDGSIDLMRVRLEASHRRNE